VPALRGRGDHDVIAAYLGVCVNTALLMVEQGDFRVA